MIRALPYLPLVAVVALGAGCSRPAASGPDLAPLDRLLDGMRQRLLVMHDVARWKWNERQPITDPAREKALLDAVSHRGKEKGLDPGRVRAFFAAQIEAAKRMQQADHTQWKEERKGSFSSVIPLASIRQTIDRLNGQLLDELAAAGPLLADPAGQRALAERATQVLTGEGITEEVREAAIAPLRAAGPR